jgi:TonB-dependent SusC/RagA subfamily outer membrane receptor
MDNANIGGNLTVIQDANIFGNITSHSNIVAFGNLVTLQDLYVARNFYLRNNLQADSAFFDTYFYTAWADAGKLTVRGNANVSGHLLLESNLNVLGDANIVGNLLIWSNLQVMDNSNIGGNLTVIQDANIGRDLTVGRNLYVIGDFILDNSIQSNTAAIHSYFYTSNANIGNILVDYEANIVGNLIIGSNLEVLKDASSLAFYGARGANGVVLITTKRGGL